MKYIRKPIYIIYLLFSISLLIATMLYEKVELHLLMNTYHNSFFDVFFKYATYLGDGIIFPILVVLFLFIRRKFALIFAISGILTLLLTSLFKRVIFAKVPRPITVIGEEKLHLIEGVKMAHWHSFPSGHTTAAFTIFTILCIYFYQSKSQYIFVFLAIIAGVSRIYLSQHFAVDVLAGSILGIMVGFTAVYIPQWVGKMRKIK